MEEKMDENIDKSLSRTGRYVIYSIWIQSQLSDLIILNRNKGIINDFNSQEIIPSILREQRYIFWEKDFREVKEIFETEFSSLLTTEVKMVLSSIYYLRNAIVHSHVSVGRKYLLYKPKNEKIVQSIKETLTIKNKSDENLNVPEIFKIDFSKDSLYFENMQVIKNFDEVFLKMICEKIGVFHPKIR
ncbi:hypothetical protein A2641_02645 [Candidatus Nomurabacteria bacterium RIFCSPHIGHO2_01_FULL_37_25]|uniref:Uncharacterized protein n=1 Tax=Candidatus Nomurabacteria bacterium RIFCSPLOWO2_01_FULL_36_16 TaxID=1801767 RepID=A0A1F6X0A0_9BACT|nr:MAG: hypothetical protein A2641_02645 [Candidatus Nomurabacteria bacterium RIFCSPHIGHO2_01_FULL_37_25]OGI75050.1 MAG: hypothetical protein A3D36_03390 [Candidatus Nomurabacteria bacterium RIFCSPHIGHO2_02_FULL_36_29]OGI87561.1 MAG: hypothetical protein A3A91_01460 [Candidatus Nomurabacteria bacterium RIFCSPLOWO2_01_FULL_36_16]